jgi:hypothetical protein
MTNTTQTNLLDGVEPDCWRYETVRGTYRYRGPCINFDKDYNSLKPVGLLTFKRVEALLEAQRAEYEARIEAHRKQVLLWLADYVDLYENRLDGDELRQMALGPTGVDKGDKG